MRSQETFTLLQSAREIKVAINADGDRVGGLLNEQHPVPVEEGEAPFDYRQHFRQLSHQLDVGIDGVVVTEDAHSDQQILSSRAQDDRDEVAVRGYGMLVSTRQGLESLFRRGGFELAFISGATPAAPRRLVEQLGQSVRLLRRPVVERRGLRVEGFDVDLGTVAGGLEGEEKALRAAIDRVDAARKAEEGSMLAKHSAIDALHRVVIWVGRTAEGLFHLAGEDELAERIRTATRRSPRPTQPTPETATDAPTTDTPPTDAPTTDTPPTDAPPTDSHSR